MKRALILSMFAILAGCDVGIPVLSGCPPVAVNYFMRNNDLQDISEFSRLDLETQYTIFICGQQRMGPPRLELSEAMAMEGPRAATFLRQKLARATDDLTIRDIINVLTLMQLRGILRVSDDPELIRLMHLKANAMRSDYRSFVERSIAEAESADSYGRYRLSPSTFTPDPSEP